MRALCSAAILGMVATLFAGCGDGDNTLTKICKPSEAVCSQDNTNSGTVCNADGTRLVEFSCSQGERCDDGACVGQCEEGTQRCASDAAAQVCSPDGRQWIPVPCDPGTACVDEMGCQPTEEGVKVCDPEGNPVCATSGTVKICDADGSGWVFETCDSDEACVDGACTFNEDTACIPGEAQCVGANSAVCDKDGASWVVTECDDATPCLDGFCRGPACIPGETRCAPVDEASFYYYLYNGYYAPYDFGSLYTCNDDGTGWVKSACDAGEQCSYDNITKSEINDWISAVQAWYDNGSEFPSEPSFADSTASCKAPNCPVPHEHRQFLTYINYLQDEQSVDPYYGGPSSISAFCGTVDDPQGTAYQNTYTQCEGLPPFANLEWVNYECADYEQCYQESQYVYHYAGGTYWHQHYWQTAACDSECIPGQVSCAGGDATSTCQDDGTFGPAEQCPTDSEYEYEYACRITATYDGTSTGTCVDPVCAYWLDTLGTLTVPEGMGACTPDGQWRPCNADGTLGDPEDCSGVCIKSADSDAFGSTHNTADQDPGYCGEECVDGDSRCLLPETALNGSPLYQNCVDGKWSAETETCGLNVGCWDGGQLDLQYGAYQQPAMNEVLCGAECTPGTVVCLGIQTMTCGDDGQWDAAEDCAFGACEQNGTFVQCEAQCLPDTFTCNGVGNDTPGSVTAYSYACEDGRWGAAVTCDVGVQESCMVDS
ncbi:MAG TPA: hypothetical protein VM686_25145, partial [Polyangiaceae bacterium]|nr:hypothetical protein [Polyangiaceae bacterium]